MVTSTWTYTNFLKINPDRIIAHMNYPSVTQQRWRCLGCTTPTLTWLTTTTSVRMHKQIHLQWPGSAWCCHCCSWAWSQGHNYDSGAASLLHFILTPTEWLILSLQGSQETREKLHCVFQEVWHRNVPCAAQCCLIMIYHLLSNQKLKDYRTVTLGRWNRTGSYICSVPLFHLTALGSQPEPLYTQQRMNTNT